MLKLLWFQSVVVDFLTSLIDWIISDFLCRYAYTFLKWRDLVVFKQHQRFKATLFLHDRNLFQVWYAVDQQTTERNSHFSTPQIQLLYIPKPWETSLKQTYANSSYVIALIWLESWGLAGLRVSGWLKSAQTQRCQN